MGQSFERYQKRRLISSYFSVVLSISLVLFLLGILGFGSALIHYTAFAKARAKVEVHERFSKN